MDMYVGNEAEYADFAVNNPEATAPVGEPNGVTYSEHEQIVDAITPPSQMPDWYKIYMGNEEFNVVIALAVNETFRGKNVSFDLDP